MVEEPDFCKSSSDLHVCATPCTHINTILNQSCIGMPISNTDFKDKINNSSNTQLASVMICKCLAQGVALLGGVAAGWGLVSLVT
jgi:hypothetical protein